MDSTTATTRQTTRQISGPHHARPRQRRFPRDRRGRDRVGRRDRRRRSSAAARPGRVPAPGQFPPGRPSTTRFLRHARRTRGRRPLQRLRPAVHDGVAPRLRRTGVALRARELREVARRGVHRRPLRPGGTGVHLGRALAAPADHRPGDVHHRPDTDLRRRHGRVRGRPRRLLGGRRDGGTEPGVPRVDPPDTRPHAARRRPRRGEPGRHPGGRRRRERAGQPPESLGAGARVGSDAVQPALPAGALGPAGLCRRPRRPASPRARTGWRGSRRPPVGAGDCRGRRGQDALGDGNQGPDADVPRCRHRNDRARAHLHVPRTRQTHGESPGLEQFDQLDYTEAVIDEAMRLYPPAYMMFREASEDVAIGGYRIPEGEKVTVPQFHVQTDPRWYDDPETFRPSRWLAGLEDDLPDYAYFPFGGGPRHCIGMPFAMMELKHIVTTIAQAVDLELLSDPDPGFAPGLTLQPADDVRVRVSK
ncbi:hypothetical protein BRC65_03490 [Halobacteriales archaeon QH_2_65_14]|nr:MAG: hypothetical protein BRC65_03490 [Halobacteriales archaeon QH_2_65_14]